MLPTRQERRVIMFTKISKSDFLRQMTIARSNTFLLIKESRIAMSKDHCPVCQSENIWLVNPINAMWKCCDCRIVFDCNYFEDQTEDNEDTTELNENTHGYCD